MVFKLHYLFQTTESLASRKSPGNRASTGKPNSPDKGDTAFSGVFKRANSNMEPAARFGLPKVGSSDIQDLDDPNKEVLKKFYNALMLLLFGMLYL